MKSIGILIATLIIYLMQLLGLHASTHTLADQLKRLEGVTCLSFSHDLIDAIDINLNDEDENLTGDLQQVDLIIYNPEKGSLTGEEFIRKAHTLLPASCKKYANPDETDPSLQMWFKGNKNRFTELFLFLNEKNEDDKQFIIFFSGNFSIKELNALKKTGKLMTENNNR